MKYFNDDVDKELMRGWFSDLRSGNFKQGTELLYHIIDDSFCCLGVLGLKLGQSEESMRDMYILKDLGIDCGIKDESAIALLNDDKEYSFEIIANILEEDLNSGSSNSNPSS